jgi:hypothetical protein
MASSLGMTTDDFLKTPAGQNLNAAEMDALRAATTTETERAMTAAAAFDRATATPEQIADAKRQMARLADLIKTAKTAGTEMGRGLNIMRQNMDKRLADGITSANEELAAVRQARADRRASTLAQARNIIPDVQAAARAAGDEEADALLDLITSLGPIRIDGKLEDAFARMATGLLRAGEREAERALRAEDRAVEGMLRAETRLNERAQAAWMRMKIVAGRRDRAAAEKLRKLDYKELYNEMLLTVEKYEEKALSAQRRREWRAHLNEMAALDRAYERMENAIEARAGRAAVRQQERLEKVLVKIAGREVTDDMLEQFVQLSKGGDPYAVAAFLRTVEKPTWAQRSRLLYYVSMLSGSATQMLNTITTGENVGIQAPDRAVAALIDSAVQRVAGGERTRYMSEVPAMLKGQAKGSVAGLSAAGRVFRTGFTERSLSNLEAGLPTTFGFKDEKLNTALEYPIRAMAASDELFFQTAFGGEVAALAERKAVREGLPRGGEREARVSYILQNLTEFPELAQEAKDRANYALYRERRAWSEGLARFLTVGGEAPVVKDVMAPFIRTPLNEASQRVGRTPLGFIGAISSALRGNRAESVDRAARATVGLVPLVIGFILGYAGYTTSPVALPKSERSTEPEGRIRGAVRIPLSEDEAFLAEYRNAGPVAGPFALGSMMGAAARNGGKGEDGFDWDRDVTRYIDGAISLVGTHPLAQTMRGINGFFEDPLRWLDEQAQSLGGRFRVYGGLQRQIVKALGIPARDPKGFGEAWQAASPLTAQNVPAKQTALGEDVAPQQEGIWSFIAPMRYSYERDTPVLRALREAGVSIPSEPDTRANIKLTREEKVAFQRAAGRRINEYVKETLALPVWQTMDAEERKAELSFIVRLARKKAEDELIDSMSNDEYDRRAAPVKSRAR